MKIFQKAGTFQGNSKVGTWIYRIAVNASLNQLSKRKSQFFNVNEEVANNVSDFVHPGILLENKEKSKILFQFINELPGAQKTAFVLSLVEGLPQKEVAEIMETSVKSVEGLLQRGKESLRKKIISDFPEGIR